MSLDDTLTGSRLFLGALQGKERHKTSLESHVPGKGLDSLEGTVMNRKRNAHIDGVVNN